MERRYERLYGDELFALIRAKPLAWLPLGILEHHGAHLPWGLDGLKAHAICLRLAERLGGVVLPANHFAGIHGDCKAGDETEFRKRAAAIGDLLYTERLLRAFLSETLDSLANIGFRVIVAYTGHYPTVQMEVVQEVAQNFNATGAATVLPFWEPLACGGGDHGGKWETSLYLALAPEAVRLELIREDGTGQPGYYRGQEVRGQASAAFGEQALTQIEAYLARAVEQAFDARELAERETREAASSS
jgi:creatinine amidohydrolase